MEEKDKISFQLFPNPAHDHLKLQYDLKERARFVLRDPQGRVALTEKLDKERNTQGIDLSGLEAGVYFFSVKKEDKVKKSGKVILLGK